MLEIFFDNYLDSSNKDVSRIRNVLQMKCEKENLKDDSANLSDNEDFEPLQNYEAKTESSIFPFNYSSKLNFKSSYILFC